MKRIWLPLILLFFPLLLFSQASYEKPVHRDIFEDPQQASGYSAQAAVEEDQFPIVDSTDLMATAVQSKDSMVVYTRPPLTARDVALQTLGGIGVGLGGAVVLGALFATLAVGAGAVGLGVAVIGLLGGLLGYFIGVPIGVFIVGNNPYRRGNFGAVFGMSVLGFLAGALVAIIPFFGLISFIVPPLMASIGFWLSSRFTEYVPTEEEYYEDEEYYYEYLRPGGLATGQTLPQQLLRKIARKRRRRTFLQRIFHKKNS